jgi:CHAT domain-containing protein/Tfp pilus assembly protein PilF
MPFVLRRSLCLLALSLSLSNPALAQSQPSSSLPESPRSSVDDFAALLAAAKDNRERHDLLEQKKELKTAELQRALLKQGQQLNEQRKFVSGVELLEFAQALSESLGDRTGVALALRNIGSTYGLQENHRKALGYYEKALAMQDAVSKSLLAELLRNIRTAHYFIGNYDAALDYSQRALAISEELQDRKEMVKVLNGMGVIYQRKGDYTQALACFQRSRKLLEAIADPEQTAILYNNMAAVYCTLGDYSRGLELLYQALKLTESLPQRRDRDIAEKLHNIGNVHLQQGNTRLALQFYERALAMQEKEGKKREIGMAHNQIGMAYNHLDNREAALEHFRQAMAIWEAIEDKEGLASTFHSIGNIYLGQRNYAQALEHLQKSLTIYESLGNSLGMANSMAGLGSAYYKQGNYLQALSLLERATPIAEKIGRLTQLAATYRLAGNVHFALGREALSRQAYEKAIAAIETLRTQTAGGEQDRQRLLETKLAPWRGIIQLLVKQKHNQEALGYAEQSKARVLLDVLWSGKVDIRKAMTSDEQEQERKLRAEIISLNAQVSRLRQMDKGEDIRDLQMRLDKARLSFEAFQTSLYAAHPELRTQRGEAPTIRAEELTELLPDERCAALEYVVTEDATYLFVITRAVNKAAVEALTLPIGSDELTKQIESFRGQLAGRDLGFREPARKLYELLLKPAEAQLRGKTTLVIVPDDTLWELPFQALLNGNNRFLIEEAAISYAPSLTVLREMIRTRQRRPTAATPLTLLALGNPSLGQETVERATIALRDGKLDPLPEAEQEVKALRRFYGATRSKVYIGREAREERAKSEAGGAGILHFATHGTLNNASPMYSHLVLARGEANEDGLLEAWELTQMELKAEMAVLSACETARGRYGAGEGMIGLTWALFVAGVPTTVVSQWKVESAGTRDLMVAFHRQLRGGSESTKTRVRKAEALRQAALKLMKNSATVHPFYWAGFVLVGDGN